jgi:hypothetical protein
MAALPLWAHNARHIFIIPNLKGMVRLAMREVQPTNALVVPMRFLWRRKDREQGYDLVTTGFEAHSRSVLV